MKNTRLAKYFLTGLVISFSHFICFGQDRIRIKATFIYNFTKYIEWPNQNKLKEFTIGYLGSGIGGIEGALIEENKTLLSNKFINDSIPFKIKYFLSIEEIEPTQILYVNRDDGFDQTKIFNRIKGKGTLLVAENLEDFNKSMINFIVLDNKQRFSLNQKIIEKEGFKINPTLLSLAILDGTGWKNIFGRFKDLLKTQKENELKIISQNKEIRQKQLEKENEARKNELLLKEKELTEAELNKQKIIVWSVVSGLLLIIVFASLIFRSLRITRKQKQIIEIKNKETERQKQIIEEKNKDITDSINYAKRIQNAKLPDKKEIQKALPNSFVLFKPKDIVSGDFYYFHKNDKSVFIASADCTGHGVPGALMSMIGSEKLDDALAHSADTSEILRHLNKGIKVSLHQTDRNESTRDGMDIAFCSVDTDARVVKYAGANRPLWIIRNGQTVVEEIKATKKAIGGFTEDSQHFDTHVIQLQHGDTFYISTDGYADTFGKQDKKLTTKKFKEILLSIQDKSLKEQEHHLDNFIEDWKGGTEQVDDILVIGVRL